ncbi:hypothetical protein JMJ77_0005320 [Colletotrichum scovillei]|uniref:Uncharacterized protein n=1 Tax=Colletotrichum scovillei TaxID=1209932 RepID=A0A9P7UHC8_9PEZI|nr:hypothetical protein JMJ77_0005320 [Colletotrichum scovillei]KAG7076484.1 hypothetical protein JMJ76_0013748 [Colletotrichum scovillei]KAG7083683.1 hypothetical protein JMJ78_0009126 [Colletotrichum scovillei]
MRYAMPPFRTHIARPHRQASGSVIYALFLTETKLDRRVLEGTRGSRVRGNQTRQAGSYATWNPSPRRHKSQGQPRVQAPSILVSLAMEVDCGPDVGSESFLFRLLSRVCGMCVCALCVGSGT